MPANSKQDVLAIIVPDLYHATQTFFHEHIAHIHPGKTVVVHLSSTGAPAMTDVPKLEVPIVPRWPQSRLPILAKALDVANSIGTSRLSAHDQARIAGFLEKHGVTHLFAEFATSGTLILPVAQRMGLPLTVLSHGWDINIMGQGRVWRRRYEKLFRSDAQLAAVCDFLRDRMLEIGAPASHVAIIPCAVNAASFEPVAHTDAPARVVMVCRLIPQKGPLRALRAFALAQAQRPGLTLDIVGNGPLMPELRREIEALNVSQAVTVHGDTSHAAALSVIAESHIFIQHCMILPMKGIESQAVSLLESMGHGLVPIVTRHGGMADHVADGVRGWLVEEGDERAMAERIVAMFDQHDERAQIGAMARRYVLDRFSREHVYPMLRGAIGLR